LGPRDAREAAGWEVEHHLAELADRLVERGMTAEEARREAEARFGDPARYRASLERDERRRRRMMRRTERWAVLVAGIGRVGRTLVRSPGFAVGVILTLSLGIGANAAMFGILDRLLFQPPQHVVDADAVRRVMLVRPFMGRLNRSWTLTYPDYVDLQAGGAFTGVAGLTRVRELTVGSGPDASRVRAVMASADLFPLLGVHPALGRFYAAEDDRIGVPATAVLSHEYWRSTMGSDADALGRTLEIDGHAFTVVGVAPRGFTGIDLAPVDVWLPLATAGGLINGPDWLDNRGWYWMGAVVRLAPGVEVGAAEAEATGLHRNARRAEGEEDDVAVEGRIALDPLIVARGPEASGESKVARWLGGVSVVVLLIACANVANLLLARGTRRRREVAVRLALGVGRSRLVAVMVLESMLLALLGGGVALLIAHLGGGVMRDLLLPGVYFPQSAVSGRVVAFVLGAALLAGLLAGVGPAIQATRADLTGDLSMGAGSGAARRSRLRGALTVAQAALSVVLLVGAGLFVRSVSEVRDLDLGLDVDDLLIVTLEFESRALTRGLRTDGATGNDGEAARNEIYAVAMERLRALPGVESVAGTSSPFQWAFATELRIPGRDSLPRLPGGGPYFQDVTPGYLETVGLEVLRGRGLEPGDDAGAPRVAVISELMASTLWPDEDPLGQCLMVEDATECTSVVGVVEHASRGGLQDAPFMVYYLPLEQRAGRRLNALYVRVAGDPARLVGEAAPLLRGFDSRVRYATVAPLREAIDPQARAWTLGAAMFSVFGLLALLVAAVGLYSVLAFDVAQRTRELGIRTALGAERGRLLRAVMRDGLRLAAGGIVLGLAAAVAAAPYAGGLLFEVSPRDPTVLAAVALVLLGVSLIASALPGLRATRVDPMVALRTE
jgi:predicted permease